MLEVSKNGQGPNLCKVHGLLVSLHPFQASPSPALSSGALSNKGGGRKSDRCHYSGLVLGHLPVPLHGYPRELWAPPLPAKV